MYIEDYGMEKCALNQEAASGEMKLEKSVNLKGHSK